MREVRIDCHGPSVLELEGRNRSSKTESSGWQRWVLAGGASTTTARLADRLVEIGEHSVHLRRHAVKEPPHDSPTAGGIDKEPPQRLTDSELASFSSSSPQFSASGVSDSSLLPSLLLSTSGGGPSESLSMAMVKKTSTRKQTTRSTTQYGARPINCGCEES